MKVLLPCEPGTKIIRPSDFGPKEDVVLRFVINENGTYVVIRGIGKVPLDQFEKSVERKAVRFI